MTDTTRQERLVAAKAAYAYARAADTAAKETPTTDSQLAQVLPFLTGARSSFRPA